MNWNEGTNKEPTETSVALPLMPELGAAASTLSWKRRVVLVAEMAGNCA